MIPATDEQAVARASRALRTGRITAEYAPPAVADLIDAMWANHVALHAELREAEQIYLLSRTHASLRTEYARGFRDAQQALARHLPDDEDLILGLKPDYIAASEGSRYVG